jgi:SAM-dependent methyltransferase
MWLLSLLPWLALLAMVSITWPALRGAPWVPTPMDKVHRMLTMAEVGPGDVVYDLGCGDGRTIVTAARRYGASAVGIEIDPLRYLWCQMLITVLRLRAEVRVVHADFFTQDLSGADVVTCYLLQSTNERLVGKLRQELRPGARVVSSDFTFPTLRMLRLDSDAGLYLYSPGSDHH